MICFSKTLNATVVLQYVSVPRGHLPGQYREGSARGQKRAGLDLAQKWPSCVGLSIRNGSLLKGRVSRSQDAVLAQRLPRPTGEQSPRQSAAQTSRSPNAHTRPSVRAGMCACASARVRMRARNRARVRARKALPARLRNPVQRSAKTGGNRN